MDRPTTSSVVATIMPTPEDPAVVAHVHELTEEEKLAEKKLVRKVDWILMPILTVTLGLQVGEWAQAERVQVADPGLVLRQGRAWQRCRLRYPDGSGELMMTLGQCVQLTVQGLIEVIRGVTYTTKYSTATAAVSRSSSRVVLLG